MKLLRATSPQARSFPPTRLCVLLPFNLLDVTGRGGSRTMNGIMEVGSETHHNSPPFFPCSRWDLRLWITTLGLRQATNDAERVRQSQLLQSRHTAITPSLSYGNSCTAANQKSNDGPRLFGRPATQYISAQAVNELGYCTRDISVASSYFV